MWFAHEELLWAEHCGELWRNEKLVEEVWNEPLLRSAMPQLNLARPPTAAVMSEAGLQDPGWPKFVEKEPDPQLAAQKDALLDGCQGGFYHLKC
jgi:hypothetical protein